MALNKEVTAKIDDHVEQLSHAGESQKQLSMKEVVEAGIDCEYILQAAECFEEGKAYIRSGNYSRAMIQFFLAVQHLITKCPDIETSITVNGEDVVNFILLKCDEYGEEVSGYCKEDSVVCSLKDFNAKLLRQKLKAALEEQQQAGVYIRGAECALLCHIASVLHTCKAALHLGERDRATALLKASNRLKKLLYNDQAMKTTSSIGSLDKYFESTTMGTDQDSIIAELPTSKQSLLHRKSSDRTEVPSWHEKKLNNDKSGDTMMGNDENDTIRLKRYNHGEREDVMEVVIMG